MISKVYDKFFSFIMNFCKLLLLAQVLIVIYVVFGRYILHSTPAWGEESALICMVWFCLISPALAIRDGSHLKMEIIEMWMPDKVIKIIDNLNQLIVFFFALFLLIAGTRLTMLTALSILPGIGIKTSWLYVSLPVAGVAMIIALTEKVKKLIEEMRK